MTKEEIAANIKGNPHRSNPAWNECFELYKKENPNKSRLKHGCGGCYQACKQFLGIK